jgi:hypothetical protein
MWQWLGASILYATIAASLCEVAAVVVNATDKLADPAKSLFVGDAAGRCVFVLYTLTYPVACITKPIACWLSRPSDHSAVDRDFAAQAGIDFYNEQAFFTYHHPALNYNM